MQEPSKEIVEALKRVRKRLRKPEAWTKGRLAKNAKGRPTSYQDTQACAWCLYGALARDAPNGYREAKWRLEDFIRIEERPRNLIRINDAPTTKHAHILKWLDTVIEHDSKVLGL